MACKACRSRKIKCDRARPSCQNCRQRSSHCTYIGERRTRRWTEAAIDAGRLSAVCDARDNFLSATGTRAALPHPHAAFAAESTTGPGRLPTTAPEEGPQDPQARQNQTPPAGQSYWSWIESDPVQDVFAAQAAYNNGALLETPTGSNSSQDEELIDKILDGDDLECLNDKQPALWMRVNGGGDEYTGPSSGISAISDQGLSWVRENVPDSDVLCETIQDIRNAVLGHIRQPKCIPQDLPLALSSPCSPRDLDHDRVMEYVEAYFSKVQVIFPILDRDTFLSQLATLGTSSDGATNCSWQALLNAVLASGCRATLSDETAIAFRISGREGWGYFRTALSFESRILHGATDLMAVQAMAVMTVFAQGLSSPQRLEYTLSSIASRLAQSLALNRHPPSEWNLAESEKRERDRVFWVIYCLDRSISLRCGRPAIIQDHEVSCCFPRGVNTVQRGQESSGTRTEPPAFDYFLCFAKLARIGGNVSRLLYSAAALYTPSHRLLPTLDRLMHDLESWLSAIPAGLRPGKPLTRILEMNGASHDQIVVLHASYYYLLCAIYRRASPLFTQENRSLEHFIDQKSHVSHIEAARCIVLLTKHLNTESFSPAWLIFYYPFTALTTIFIHVASNPPSALTQSDIALMETVVGFFGRLEYVTSGEAAFTKTGEFVRQARSVAERYSNRMGPAPQIPSSTEHNSLVTTVPTAPEDPARADGSLMQVDKALSGGSDHEDEGVAASITVGGPLGGIAPTEPEVAEGERHVESGAAPEALGVAYPTPAFYADLAGLLVHPPGGDSSEHWL
ncbi:hypothetical protein ACJZ2D_016656 [Fusarium nematophilum]